jgi:hypothetical protein
MRAIVNKASVILAILGIVVCSLGTQLAAQEISKYDLEQRALNHFANHRYDKAAADFELLYTMFPKDARYSYYLGRSYLHSNKNLERSAELLKFAATRNYGDDAYFYLGQAYHALYMFEDAALTFNIFKKTVSERKQKKYDIEYWISVTENARQSVLVAQNLRVENLRVIPSNSLESAFQDNFNGKYIYVPEELRSQTDRENRYQALMFLPDDLQDGDILYFTCLSNKQKQGEDIYWVQRLHEKEYSLPEPLPDIINTPYDDAYPFFDKTNNTLYFSSRGHNTSGGYDIFKSVYDDQKKTWSIPEKLDFPINSVRNDFMLSFNSTMTDVVFLTDRNSGLRELEAYTIQYPFTGEYLSTNGYDEILTYALLSPASVTIDEEKISQSDQTAEILLADNFNETSSDQTLYTPDEYSQLINEALKLQSQSDSLQTIVQEMRESAQNEHNFLKKQDLVANLTTLDKESIRLKQIADEKFALAEQIKNSSQAGLIAVKAESPATVNSSSGITLYKYNTGSDATQPPETMTTGPGYNEGMQAAKEVVADVNIAFNILNTSPYSEDNPIPFASLPSGLVYKIQLGSYSNPVPENTFGGLTPVSKENTDSNTKYYVGEFTSIKDAREALRRVKEYGYPDAFLVSFFDSKKISVQEAREIEFAEK